MGTVLQRVVATAGFLERCEIRLTPGLNCIIGSRGTCKSTLVESIRFAFDVDPDRVQVLLGSLPKDDTSAFIGFRDMIAKTLGTGTVLCELRDDSEDSYSVERDHDSVRRIYREGVKDHSEPGGIERIEIYSQGDLQRIADKDDLRLGLIDRPNAPIIGALRRKQQDIAAQLRQMGHHIKNLRGQADALQAQVRELPGLRAQMEQVRLARPEFSRDLERERDLHQRRQTILRTLSEVTGARDSAATLLRNLREPLGRLQNGAREIEAQRLGSEGEEALAAVSALSSLVFDLASQIDSVEAALPAALQASLAAAYEASSEPYYQLRRQEQEANESLKREDALRQNINTLEMRETELDAVLTRFEEARRERLELRRQFESLGEEVVRLRFTEVHKINTMPGTSVILALVPGGQGKAYAEKILRMLQGSRLHGQEAIAKDLAEQIRPADLIDLVEAGDTSGLAAMLNREVSQVTRLMSFLMDSSSLYDLEGHIFEDQLDMTMIDGGETKPVESLSKGQKATALLPLILRPAAYPLIFDQPEDDLDNRFIFDSLVQTVRQLKQERQIIFITHNANIPVIGEAENVVVMRMDSPTKAGSPTCGSVDERKKEIIDLLEGGAKAFIERQRRYQGLLASQEESQA